MRQLDVEDMLAIKLDDEAWEAAVEMAEQATVAGLDAATQLEHGIKAYLLAAQAPAKKQTSAEMSSIAGRYMSVATPVLVTMVGTNPDQVAKDVRRMAASLLSQDETVGQ